MGIDNLLKEKREEILQIAAKHGFARIRVFGSAARGESREGSDVDLHAIREPLRQTIRQEAIPL